CAADLGVGACDHGRPFGLGLDQDGVGVGPDGTVEQGRGAGGGADVDVAGPQVLVRPVGAVGLGPFDLDVVGGELLLQPAVLQDHQGERVVGGEVDVERLQLLIASACGGGQQCGGGGE